MIEKNTLTIKERKSKPWAFSFFGSSNLIAITLFRFGDCLNGSAIKKKHLFSNKKRCIFLSDAVSMDKILTSWSGLMIMAKATKALHKPEYAQQSPVIDESDF